MALIGNYNDSSRKATEKYIREKQAQITLRFRTEDYEKLLPFIRRSGLPVATFIKQAISEKIERDFGVAGDAP